MIKKYLYIIENVLVAFVAPRKGISADVRQLNDVFSRRSPLLITPLGALPFVGRANKRAAVKRTMDNRYGRPPRRVYIDTIYERQRYFEI